MPINVVCPGCYKRFQVSEQFAGKRGPCPSCQTMIDIPKEEVKIHAPDEFISGGKTVKGRTILQPLTRLSTDLKTRDMVISLVGLLLVFGLVMLFPALGLGRGVLNIIGIIGLFLVAFPLVYFGQRLLKDGDDLVQSDSTDVLRKCAICAGAYAILSICFEFLSKYMQADGLFIWVYLVPFALFSMFVAHVVFDLDFSRGLFHYLLFFVPVILLRGLMGLGWVWNAAFEITSGPGAPPPPPPGLGP